MVLEQMECKTDSSARDLDLYIATVGERAANEAFSVLHELRREGVKAEMDFEGRSLKAQMRSADRKQARYAAILGEDELDRGMITLRQMDSGEQTEVELDNICSFVKAGK